MNRPPRRFPRNAPRRHGRPDVHLSPTAGNAPTVREAMAEIARVLPSQLMEAVGEAAGVAQANDHGRKVHALAVAAGGALHPAAEVIALARVLSCRTAVVPAEDLLLPLLALLAELDADARERLAKGGVDEAREGQDPH